MTFLSVAMRGAQKEPDVDEAAEDIYIYVDTICVHGGFHALGCPDDVAGG